MKKTKPGQEDPTETLRLRIPGAIVDALIAQAQRERPRECCGLLAGIGKLVERAYPLVNESAGEREYFVAAGLFGPFKRMRERGEELLAIYHSHPAGPAYPSSKDQQRNYYPDTPHLIVALGDAGPKVRAFLISPDEIKELKWERLD